MYDVMYFVRMRKARPSTFDGCSCATVLPCWLGTVSKAGDAYVALSIIFKQGASMTSGEATHCQDNSS